MAGVHTKCVADRAVQITRDTGLAAALSRDAAYTSTAAPVPPCGQASLTRSRTGLRQPDPRHVCPIAGTRLKGIAR
jgi:hypothetical protein